MKRDRFLGQIAGLGSSSGVRVVIGHWSASPLGAFSDVMVATADGTRVLLAPTRVVADYVASTYTFDEVRVGPVAVTERPAGWSVRAPQLDVHFEVGRRLPLGWALRVLPRRLATSPTWTLISDPVARIVVRGVRTRGQARPGRREFYGATDLRAIRSLTGTWNGYDLGTLAPVWPGPDFGFGSTPRTPAVTAVVTTVETS